MAVFRDILAATSGATPTIVLSEGADPRVAEAAVAASVANLAKIICIGDPALVQAALAAAGGAGDIVIEDPATSPRLPGYVADYVQKRAAKGMTPEKAQLELSQANFFAAAMVAAGDADGTIGGAVYFFVAENTDSDPYWDGDFGFPHPIASHLFTYFWAFLKSGR